MSVPSEIELIGHMTEAASQAMIYIEGLHKDDFLADKRTQQAVVLNLIVLGEAASRMMDRQPEFVSAHPEIEWQGMRGMRNRIAHGYYEIDMETVWQTISVDLPELVEKLNCL